MIEADAGAAPMTAPTGCTANRSPVAGSAKKKKIIKLRMLTIFFLEIVWKMCDRNCVQIEISFILNNLNECCSRAIKSNNSQKQLDNSSLQALWLNSSVEISS